VRAPAVQPRSRWAEACAGRGTALRAAEGQASPTESFRALTLAPTASGVPGKIIVVEPTGARPNWLIQVGTCRSLAHARRPR